MAVRFYKELNDLSTADFLVESKRKKGKYHEVERIISRRTRKRKPEYLVKWKGYSSLVNSWEPEENLNSLALRTYWNPKPAKELVSSGTDTLHAAILENLASKSTLPTLVCFRHDVFQYFFNNKGTHSDGGRHLLLEKEDFLHCMLPKDWDQLLDQLGNGVRVAFPVKARLFLSKSPKNNTFTGGQIQPLPRYNIEKLSINCRKQPFIVS